MKITYIIVRSLMGLLFLFASITFLFNLITPPEPTGAMKIFGEGLAASIYLMPTVKLIELLCGIAFVSGRFVVFAAVLITPIIINIFFVHVFVAPEGLPIAIFLVLAISFVAYYNRESYKQLFKM
ncbi:MAG: DoxX family protein [Ignavibacteriales bacterium]|nr:DoxX family protein [Ignavibacteriales bacterium]